MGYNLYIDDERDPPEGEWAIARSFWDVKKIIAEQGMPDLVSFDYYLMDKYTGKDCAEFIYSRCYLMKRHFPAYILHSSAEDGRMLVNECIQRWINQA